VTLASPVTIPANKNDGQLTLKADADAPVTASAMQITGLARQGDSELTHPATIIPGPPDAGADAQNHALWLAVAVPTPFKFVGAFETRYIPRGSVFVRKYRVDRNGFEGPLEVRLADRQGRHLQGVTAIPVIVPAGQSDFEFGVTLPPWMEIGRTCRSTLSIAGVITDPDGTAHTVSFSSNDQNNQMIALVDPGRLALQFPRATMAAKPGAQVDVPIAIQRGSGLSGAVIVEVVAARSTTGSSASRLALAADESRGTLSLAVSQEVIGHSLTIRATTHDERGLPVTAEATLTIVGEP